MSAVCSIFTSNYVLHWSKYFDSPLLSAPSFDGRVVMYPTDRDLRYVTNSASGGGYRAVCSSTNSASGGGYRAVCSSINSASGEGV